MKKTRLFLGIATMLVSMLIPTVSSIAHNNKCTWREIIETDENGIDRIICPAFSGNSWCTAPCDGMVEID